MFLTQSVNDAGCYAIKLNVDGVEKVIVIDDFVPIKKNKIENDAIAFSKTSYGNEVWMILLEKAIAKVYGSYEAMENQSIEKGFNIIAGGPSYMYKLSEY